MIHKNECLFFGGSLSIVDNDNADSWSKFQKLYRVAKT